MLPVFANSQSSPSRNSIADDAATSGSEAKKPTLEQSEMPEFTR